MCYGLDAPEPRRAANVIALVAMAIVVAMALALAGCDKQWQVLSHTASALQDAMGAAEKWDHDAKRLAIAKCPKGDVPCAVAALDAHRLRRAPLVAAVDVAAPTLVEAEAAINAGAKGDNPTLIAKILDAIKALTVRLMEVRQ